MREDLKGITGTFEGPEETDESRHFYVCAHCGQAVDMRDLGAVIHHEERGHEPLPVS